MDSTDIATQVGRVLRGSPALGLTRAPFLFPPPPQGQAYKDCVDRYGGRHTFLGFIDFDEFLVILDDKVRGPLERFMMRA